MEKLGIGGGKGVVGKLFAADPGEIRAADCARFVIKPGAMEKLEPHSFFRIFVRDGFDEFPDFDFDAEFLHQFALQTFLGRFAGIHLAAGKFPKTAEMGFGMAKRDEKQSVTKNKSGGDFNRIGW